MILPPPDVCSLDMVDNVVAERAGGVNARFFSSISAEWRARVQHYITYGGSPEHVGTWQLELRKHHDDPLDLDEVILHVTKADDCSDARLRELLDARFASEVEMHPNRIEFHTADEMKTMQGTGTQLKEVRIVDHRPTNRKNGDVPKAGNERTGELSGQTQA